MKTKTIITALVTGGVTVIVSDQVFTFIGKGTMLAHLTNKDWTPQQMLDTLEKVKGTDSDKYQYKLIRAGYHIARKN